MIPLRHAAIWLFASLVPAGAETVSVTSGEHDGYTRIVFKVVPSVDWKLQLGSRSVELQFPAQSLEFNETAIFDRISNDRLTNVHSANTANGAIFQMSLGCDCEVSAFEYLNDYIVVDISDSKSETVDMVEPTHSTPYLQSPELPSRDAALVASIPLAVPLAPSYVSSSNSVNFPPIISEEPLVGMTVVSRPDTVPFSAHELDVKEEMEVDRYSTELRENISTARTSLLEQLTMAAEQGLLEFSIQQDLPLKESEIEPKEIAEAAEVIEVVLPTDERQVNFQTVFSRDAGLANQQDEVDASHCNSHESINVASWGSGSDFNAEISEIRTSYLMEFDEPDTAEVLKLIHLYLRYGFGVEAVSYLEEFKEVIADYELLSDLASVVDGRSLEFDRPLAKSTDCDGLVGLWAVVGVYPVVPDQIGNLDSLIAAFAAMPSDLRRLLGARLAMAFLDRGLLEESALISDILERAPGEHGAEHDLTIAQIKQSEGRAVEAKEILEELVGQTSDTSVDALISLAEMQLEHGEQISDGMLIDLGAAADENRGTEKGTQLRRLEVLWVSKTAGGISALELVSQEIERHPDTEKRLREVAGQVLFEMSPADDSLSDYIEAVIRFQHFIELGALGDELRLAIGHELLVSGLPNMATTVLLPLIDRHVSAGQILTAKAQLAMYRADLALELLGGATGDKASRIRVEAFLAQEQFDLALAELSIIHNHELRMAEATWYAGDWVNAGSISAAAEEIRRNYLANENGHIAPEPLPADTTELGGGVVDHPVTLSVAREVLSESNAVSQELQEAILGL